MPVRAHRHAWFGQPVLVASQLRQSDPITAFDEQGSRMTLDTGTPPTVPTFAIVPSETNFAEEQPRGAALSMMDDECGPDTEIICDDPGAGGAGNLGIPSNAPTGLYMTFSDLYDAAEPWIRGDPEVEAHVLGPNPVDPTSTIRDVQCAGETQSGWYQFDQNANQWSGAVLLLTGEQLDAYGYRPDSPGDHKFAVSLYEDDNESCIIRDDPNRVKDDLGALLLLGAANLFIATCPTSGCAIFSVLLDGILTVDIVADLIQGNDDYLGAVVNGLVDGYSNSSSNCTLLKHGNAVNGGIRLTYHVYGS